MNEIDNTEVARARDAIRVVGTLIKGVDFDMYLRSASHYDAIGPFVDPTTWMQTNRDTQRMMETAARLLGQLQKAIMEFENKVSA